MTDQYTELAHYFPMNPDPHFSGCLNTKEQEDGVVFPGVDPDVSPDGVPPTAFYIGRTSIIEAVAALYGLKPMRVKQLLGGDKRNKEAIKTSDEKIAELEAELAKWHRWAAAAEHAGLSITHVE